MTLKEQVNHDLERLDETGLREVADFVAFLRFRTRRQAPSTWDEAKMAALYNEFAEEDRALAEAGMEDYAAGLPERVRPNDGAVKSGGQNSIPFVAQNRPGCVRPLIFQNDAVSRFTTTVLAMPLTTNLRRAQLPSCVLIRRVRAD